VEMSNEQPGQMCGIERFDSELLSRRLRLADNTGSGIEKVGLPIDNNGNAGPGSGGIGNWSSRAQDDYFRTLGCHHLSHNRDEPGEYGGSSGQLQSWHLVSPFAAAVYT
jgi:hypothetical protein